jgi:hypothetical protein
VRIGDNGSSLFPKISPSYSFVFDFVLTVQFSRQQVLFHNTTLSFSCESSKCWTWLRHAEGTALGFQKKQNLALPNNLKICALALL